MKWVLRPHFSVAESFVFLGVLTLAPYHPVWVSALALAAGAMAISYLERRFLP